MKTVFASNSPKFKNCSRKGHLRNHKYGSFEVFGKLELGSLIAKLIQEVYPRTLVVLNPAYTSEKVPHAKIDERIVFVMIFRDCRWILYEFSWTPRAIKERWKR